MKFKLTCRIVDAISLFEDEDIVVFFGPCFFAYIYFSEYKMGHNLSSNMVAYTSDIYLSNPPLIMLFGPNLGELWYAFNTFKVTSISWKDKELNMVDTPGHADFGGEVSIYFMKIFGG